MRYRAFFLHMFYGVLLTNRNRWVLTVTHKRNLIIKTYYSFRIHFSVINIKKNMIVDSELSESDFDTAIDSVKADIYTLTHNTSGTAV